MTKSEVANLLALAAAMDQRTVGRTDVEAWFLVLASVPFDRARTAVAEHYRDTGGRISPSDVVRRTRLPVMPFGAESPRPDQAEINARGRLLCMAVLAGRRGPLVEDMREAVDRG